MTKAAVRKFEKQHGKLNTCRPPGPKRRQAVTHFFCESCLMIKPIAEERQVLVRRSSGEDAKSQEELTITVWPALICAVCNGEE